MAHNITQRENGLAECMVVGQPAWHNLGQVVEKAQTWAGAIKHAGLDWTVSKQQLEFQGNPVDAWGIFRDDEKQFLGAVGGKYEPMQNVDLFKNADYIIKAEGEAHYETAGSLLGGQQVWGLIKLKDEIRIKGTDDITKSYLLALGRHDGKGANQIKQVNTRVVCNNTLNIALREQGAAIRFFHTKAAENQIEHAKKVLASVKGDIKELNTLMNALATVRLDITTMKEVLQTLFPDVYENKQQQRKVTSILKLYDDNDGDAFKSQRGTAYNLLNAITRYTDHSSDVRVRDGESEAEARARSAMFGIGEAFKFYALQTIVQAVQNKGLATMPETTLIDLGAK